MVNEDYFQSLIHCLGHKWSLEILHYLHHHIRRYNDLSMMLHPCSSKTLSIRLLELQHLKLISKKTSHTPRVNTHYRLTKKGKIVAETLNQLKNKMEAEM